MYRFIIKLFVTVVFTYLSLKKINLEIVTQDISHVKILPILLSFVCLLAMTVLSSLRWKVTLDVYETDIGFVDATKITMIGQFFNQVLPSSVGGDAIRLWILHGKMPTSIIMASIIIDRIFGMVVLILMGLFSVILSTDKKVYDTIMNPLIIVFLILLLFYVVIMRISKKNMGHLTIFRNMLSIHNAILLVCMKIKTVIMIILCSLVGHLGSILVVYLLAYSLNVKIGLLLCFIIIPITGLISAMPISISGWGVRESVFVSIFSYYGLKESDAFSLSIMYGFLNLFFGLLCGLFWINFDREAIKNAKK